MRRSRACNPFPHDRDYAFDSDHICILPLPSEEAAPEASHEPIQETPAAPGEAAQKEKQL